MPLPLIPLLLGGASIIAGGYGVKKGLDAKEYFDKARSIGDSSKDRYDKAIKSLDSARDKTNKKFMQLGETKVEIFSDQIKYLVDEIKKRSKAKSSLKGFEQMIKELDIPQMEKMVKNSLEIENGVASGVASGALMGLGAYGSVGMLASASTGTAIASLSGAAATNATLAWLGGGALSAGGLGVAGGTAVLGGLVAGPALAITGLVMASKAEEALTKAREYESEVDQAIASMEPVKVVLEGLQENVKEMEMVLRELTIAFDRCRSAMEAKERGSFERLLATGKALKNVLDTPILEEDGTAVKNLKSKITFATSGLLDYEE